MGLKVSWQQRGGRQCREGRLAQVTTTNKNNRIITAKIEKGSEISEFIFHLSRIKFSKNVPHHKGKG